MRGRILLCRSLIGRCLFLLGFLRFFDQRQGEQQTVEVVIGELPEDDQLQQASVKPGTARSNRIGITVRELDKDEKEQLGLEKETGLLVASVKSGPAYEAGIRKGDVIQMINNVWLKSLDDFRQEMENLPKGKSVAVLVYRRNGPLFLAMKVPDDE